MHQAFQRGCVLKRDGAVSLHHIGVIIRCKLGVLCLKGKERMFITGEMEYFHGASIACAKRKSSEILKKFLYPTWIGAGLRHPSGMRLLHSRSRSAVALGRDELDLEVLRDGKGRECAVVRRGAGRGEGSVVVVEHRDGVHLGDLRLVVDDVAVAVVAGLDLGVTLQRDADRLLRSVLVLDGDVGVEALGTVHVERVVDGDRGLGAGRLGLVLARGRGEGESQSDECQERVLEITHGGSPVLLV